jgi:hypothetical protein
LPRSAARQQRLHDFLWQIQQSLLLGVQQRWGRRAS